MNETYRTIWSKVRDAYVVVAEIVAGNGGPSRGKAAAAVKVADRVKVAPGASVNVGGLVASSLNMALQTVRDVLDAPSEGDIACHCDRNGTL